jgi:hypothetical protein
MSIQPFYVFNSRDVSPFLNIEGNFREMKNILNVFLILVIMERF